MHHALPERDAGAGDGYLVSRGHAWFAMVMTIGLMIFDYVDRQVIVSLFPHLKAEWSLSDAQLGALVSVVSITVAIGAIPVALFADRVSRVKSIVVMATIWSLATISCMFSRNYGQLLAARSVVGCGEAGYGSVGAALLANHFPARVRGAVMASLFASASVGSVLGVVIGGVIASHWGWKAAFGVVGFPGLVFALLYIFVRDYRTVKLDPARQEARRSTRAAAGFIARALVRSRTMRWICIGAPAQLIVVSAVWSWLPSFLNRVHGMDVQSAALKAALVVLAGAVGSVVWGWVVDRAGRTDPARKLRLLAVVCVVTAFVVAFAFGAPSLGIALSSQAQFALIVVGGFMMTCTVGPVAAIVIDVIHPGVRNTGCAVLSLFQNLFGLALGAFVAGMLSDALGLQTALTVIPVAGLFAAGAMLVASRTYADDMQTARSAPPDVGIPGAPSPALA